jgi:Trypsin-co-occurring domain 2
MPSEKDQLEKIVNELKKEQSFYDLKKTVNELNDKLLKLEQEADSKKHSYFWYFGIGVLIIGFLFGYPFLTNWFYKQTVVDNEKKLEITELIRDVKKQIVEASILAEDNKETPYFRLKDVDLEINYTVKNSGTSSGKTEFYVISADNSSQTDLEKAQKITLHLDAIQEYKETIKPDPNQKIDATEDETVTHDPLPPPKITKKKIITKISRKK